MSLKFDIIRKNRLVSSLRWGMIVPIIIGIYLDSDNPMLIYKLMIATSLGFYLLLTISFFLFIKRFKTVGSIILEDTIIKITHNGLTNNFPIDQDIDMRIIINGYRGQSMQYMYIVISEGIGEITIKYKDSFEDFDIFVNKDIRKKLYSLLDIYRSKGASVSSIIKPK